MFAARNLHKHCFKSLPSLLQLHPNLSKNGVTLGHAQLHISSSIIQVQPHDEVTSKYSSIKPFDLSNGSCRAMSTKGRSMRSKVERRMQKESGKTLREIRRAKKLKKKLMTEEERLIYNLKRAKKKVALLLQKLKKYELPDLPPPRHDPELLTPEQLQAFKKIGFRNKNYVPVGVRGVFGGVVQNMHMHWKFHETVQVCCDNFPKEKIKEMASMLARLSGGIVINVHNVKTIIMFRGRNYRQPKNLIPVNTLTKRKALFKARFEQALESQKLNIKKLEQQLRRMGVNPEDPAAMASIQRVASTFFNAIDKKEGSPYVFNKGKPSLIEPPESLEEQEASDESDQEELDRFIAEIEDAADKEYEAEEAKEKEEMGRIRYWNKEEYSGRFRRLDASRNDDYDDEGGSRVRQKMCSRHRAADSEDEDNAHSDDNDDDEWHSSNTSDASDLDGDSDSDNPIEARPRFQQNRIDRRKQNNISTDRSRIRESPNRHSEAKFRNIAPENSESEGMFSDVENAMWESDEEESDEARLRQFREDYKSSSSEDGYAHRIKSEKRNGTRDQEVKVSDSEDWMLNSDSEEHTRVSRADRCSEESNASKKDNKRTP
ncbi:hypothetical protein PIB30_041443 [Stylosanthes scabra]|uniref:CRM domain-containing protein n=1 Tax=Stylosanthes scabra TaxID=79078 RepID=A0ABU6YCB0_9FABA|nr:hypothetical protein [Stylosanthes scabra]